MSRRRKVQKRSVTPHRYIIHAECAWYESGYRYSHTTVDVVAMDPLEAVEKAEKEIKTPTLCKFTVDRIIDRGATTNAEEEHACITIGLL